MSAYPGIDQKFLDSDPLADYGSERRLLNELLAGHLMTGNAVAAIDELRRSEHVLDVCFEQPCGVEEGYIGHEHAQAVFNRYVDSGGERLLHPSVPVLPARLGFLLHDIGKGQAFLGTGSTASQHVHTNSILHGLHITSGLDWETYRFITAFVTQDRIGDWLLGRGPEDDVLRGIEKKADFIGMGVDESYSLDAAYFWVDSSGYTTAARWRDDDGVERRGLHLYDVLYKYPEEGTVEPHPRMKACMLEEWARLEQRLGVTSPARLFAERAADGVV